MLDYGKHQCTGLGFSNGINDGCCTLKRVKLYCLPLVGGCSTLGTALLREYLIPLRRKIMMLAHANFGTWSFVVRERYR